MAHSRRELAAARMGRASFCLWHADLEGGQTLRRCRCMAAQTRRPRTTVTRAWTPGLPARRRRLGVASLGCAHLQMNAVEYSVVKNPKVVKRWSKVAESGQWSKIRKRSHGPALPEYGGGPVGARPGLEHPARRHAGARARPRNAAGGASTVLQCATLMQPPDLPP